MSVKIRCGKRFRFRGGGAPELGRSQEVKKSSYLNLVRYYVTKALRSIIKIFPLSGEELRKRGATHVDLPVSQRKYVFTLAKGATHVALPNCQCKYGFTLAEVLITLGIIGVVAAMTMPAVLSGKNKQDTVARVKKAYSVLSQAHLMAINTFGDYELWDDGFEIGAQAYFNKYYKPYLKSVRICDDYCGYNESSPWFRTDGTKWNYSVYFDNSRLPCILSDGTLVVFSTGAGSVTTSSNNYIYFDINANKQPNKLGRDTFIFTRSAQGIRPLGYEYDDNTINSNCSKQGSGTFCAAKMMRDGWQIKDNYPW